MATFSFRRRESPNAKRIRERVERARKERRAELAAEGVLCLNRGFFELEMLRERRKLAARGAKRVRG